MKWINCCSCPMLLTFSDTCCAWFDYYDQLPICSSVRMACGKRQPPRLLNLYTFGLVASLVNTRQNGHCTPLLATQVRICGSTVPKVYCAWSVHWSIATGMETHIQYFKGNESLAPSSYNRFVAEKSFGTNYCRYV